MFRGQLDFENKTPPTADFPRQSAAIINLRWSRRLTPDASRIALPRQSRPVAFLTEANSMSRIEVNLMVIAGLIAFCLLCMGVGWLGDTTGWLQEPKATPTPTATPKPYRTKSNR